MTESGAERELDRLAGDLDGPAVNDALVVRVLNEAESISNQFPASRTVARQCDAIRRKAAALRPPPSQSPRVRLLAQRLSGGITPASLTMALTASGFARRDAMDEIERRHFEEIVGRALHVIWHLYTAPDGRNVDVVRVRIEQLEQLDGTLPDCAVASRRSVAALTDKLRQHAADTEFVAFQQHLRQAGDAPDSVSLPELEEAYRGWVQAGRSPWELDQARVLLDRLRMAATHVARAIALRQVVDDRLQSHGILAAIQEIADVERSADRRDRRVEDALQLAMAPVRDALAARLAACTASDASVATASELEREIADLHEIDAILQAIPPALRSDPLDRTCRSLTGAGLRKLNERRLTDAKQTLLTLEIDAVPTFITALESDPDASVELRAWTGHIRRVVSAVGGSDAGEREGAADFAVLHDAAVWAGESPLAAAARAAVTQRERAAAMRCVTRAKDLLVRIQRELGRVDPTLGERAATVDAAVALAAEYEALEESQSAAAARALLPEEWRSLDTQARDQSMTALPTAIHQWAGVVVGEATNAEEVTRCLERLASWTERRWLLRAEVEPKLRQARTRLEVEALVARGAFGDALATLAQNQEWRDSEYDALRRHVERLRAAAAYRVGDEAAVVRAIEAWGADATLIGLLVTHLKNTGDGRPLAGAAAFPWRDFEDPASAALARWSRLFEAREYDSVASGLAQSDLREPMMTFVAALARAPSHLGALRVVGGLDRRLPPSITDVHAAIAQSRAQLQDAYRIRHSSIQRTLQAWSTQFLGALPAAAERRLTDGELVQELDRAVAEATASLNAMRGEAAEIVAYLMDAQSLPDLSPPPDSLYTEVRRFEARLRANELFLLRFREQWAATLLDGWKTVPKLFDVVMEQPADSLAAPIVRRICRVAREFLDNYQPIIDRVLQLVGEHEAGCPDGQRARLEQWFEWLEHHYDFAPDQDRFRLARVLRGRDWESFRGELRTMAAEVNSVADFERRLNAVEIGAGARLRVRVADSSPAVVSSIREALETPIGAQSPLELLRSRPKPQLSAAARTRMEHVRQSSIFRLLEEAADRVDRD